MPYGSTGDDFNRRRGRTGSATPRQTDSDHAKCSHYCFFECSGRISLVVFIHIFPQACSHLASKSACWTKLTVVLWSYDALNVVQFYHGTFSIRRLGDVFISVSALNASQRMRRELKCCRARWLCSAVVDMHITWPHNTAATNKRWGSDNCRIHIDVIAN